MKNLIIVTLFALLTWGAPSMAIDLTTPENALRSLEYAYRHKDIETAVAAKDFHFEAVELLRSQKNFSNADDKLIQETAEVLELAFRKQIKNNGFPVVSQLQCSVVKRTQINPNLVEMVEECIFPDRGKSTDTFHAFKSDHGWHIVIRSN
jgi:hypothetical protein